MQDPPGWFGRWKRSETMLRAVVFWAWVLAAALPRTGSPVERSAIRPPGRTFYVDSQGGDDNQDGLTAARAWRSLHRVNTAELAPGDTVRFRSGGVWRGSLIPASGQQDAPVTYTAYGQGPKPLLLGSRPRDRREDWTQVGDHLWATLPNEYRLGAQRLDLRSSLWRHHQEAGAQVAVDHCADSGGTVVRIDCTHSGSAANHVQLWGPEVEAEQGDWLVLTFNARSTRPFLFPGVSVLHAAAPWTRYAGSAPSDHAVDRQWETYQVAVRVVQTPEAGRLHLGLGGRLPAGAVFEFQPQSLHAAAPTIADPLDVDVGNIIFDGAVCGWKRWSLDELRRPYDYYYDPASQRVFLYSDAAPTSKHRSIELALARHVVNQTGVRHAVYDGLAVMYGAAHGFGGSNTRNIAIRNCDVAYIGGGHQHTRPDGTPVRYGNGIEFWSAARDHLVENCRIWEIYDAAVTNQGNGSDSVQVNITYRNNLIWNAEYSFEYWNRPETAVTRDIRFIHNTCINAGGGWAHAQRPDPNGAHLMFFHNAAGTSGITVRYNIFHGASHWGSRYTNRWESLPDVDYNLWFSRTGVAVYWLKDKIAPFDEYRRTTGLDAHSQFAEPQFVAADRGDYRLADGSPGSTLRPDGGPVGAQLP